MITNGFVDFEMPLFSNAFSCIFFLTVTIYARNGNFWVTNDNHFFDFFMIFVKWFNTVNNSIY